MLEQLEMKCQWKTMEVNKLAIKHSVQKCISIKKKKLNVSPWTFEKKRNCFWNKLQKESSAYSKEIASISRLPWKKHKLSKTLHCSVSAPSAYVSAVGNLSPSPRVVCPIASISHGPPYASCWQLGFLFLFSPHLFKLLQRMECEGWCVLHEEI